MSSGPTRHRVTDITYICTHEGWLYLAEVIDLYLRQVVGWAMDGRMQSDLVLQPLLVAVWRRKPLLGLMLYSDQGIPVHQPIVPGTAENTRYRLLLEPTHGNCHGKAVAESFFQLLNHERIKRRAYMTRDAARSDIFVYIEIFYCPVQRHNSNAAYFPRGLRSRLFYQARKRIQNRSRFTGHRWQK